MASQNAEAAFGDRPELLETRLAVISADPNMLPENLPDKAETTDEESQEPAVQPPTAGLSELAARGQRIYEGAYAIRRRLKTPGDRTLRWYP